MAQYGRTTVGAAWFGCEVRFVARKITLAAPETAVKISAYLRSQGSATNGLKAALYNASDNTLAYQSSELAGFTDTTGAWRDFTFTGTIAAGTYWLGVVGDGIPGGSNTVEIAMDTVTADTANLYWWYYAQTWPTLEPDLDGLEGGFDLGTSNVSIYLEASFSVPLSDNFNRADEAPLASPWVSHPIGGVRLLSNVTRHPSSGGTDKLSYHGDSQAGDSQVEISVVGAADGGPFIHASAVGYNGYVLTGYVLTTIRMYRVDAGAWTFLADHATAYAAGGVLRLRRSGGNVIGSYNGTDIITVADSTHTTGFDGINIYDGTIAFDNWTNRIALSAGPPPSLLATIMRNG